MPQWLQVREAAAAVSDWTESCAATRSKLRKQVDQVVPVKAKVLELLGVQTEADIPPWVDPAKCELKAADKVTAGQEGTCTLTVNDALTGLALDACAKTGIRRSL